jgi:uncharacterized protein (DUF58 family)
MANEGRKHLLPPEVVQQIQRIHIKSSHMVDAAFAGEYESAFKGRGIEFEEVREYVPGDDVRLIDWNVTARMGHPFIKSFREERELTVLIAVDLSRSNRFGSVKVTKAELAAELAAVLAMSAIRNNDRVGLLMFTDQVEGYVPPRKGRGHVWRLIREVLTFEPTGRGTNLSVALEYAHRVTSHKAILFVVSDFVDEGFERTLTTARQMFDLIAVSIVDPREEQLPRIGLVELEDAETGEVILVDTDDLDFQRDFRRIRLDDENRLDRVFRRARVDHLGVRTDKPYLDVLVKFFRMREKRM